MRDRLEQLLGELVARDSVNPVWNAGPGEKGVAEFIVSELTKAGLKPTVQDIGSGRANVVATISGAGSAQSVLLNAHMDVVGTEDMDDPFSQRREGDKLYGRGAYDMKGSAAIMLALAEHFSDHLPPGDVHLTFVADEEDLSLGMERLIENWLPTLSQPPAAGIFMEPTEEQIGICHKGFAWYEMTITGKASHGSLPQEGVDAAQPLGSAIAEIAKIQSELHHRALHPLLGYATLHIGTVEGGSALPVIAAESKLTWERRILPGEERKSLSDELKRVAGAADAFPGKHSVAARELFYRPPHSLDAAVEIIRRLQSAAPSAELKGMSYWADSALGAAAGIPSVLFGPIGHGAHAIDEWVSLSSLVRVYESLLRLITTMDKSYSD